MGRGDSEEALREKLLAFTPLDAQRDSVYSFLVANLSSEAELHLDESPPPNWQPAGYSTITVRLWVRYVFGGQYETIASYVFNENRRLTELTVFTADAFW